MRKIRLQLQRPRQILVVLLALGGLAGLVPFTLGHAKQSEDSGCTVQTIAGNYGYRVTGVQPTADGTVTEFAAIGRYIRDGQGNASGTITTSLGGTIGHSTFIGTYTVNSDCSGSQKLTFANGAVRDSDFVIVDQGQRVEFLILNNPGASVISGTQTKE